MPDPKRRSSLRAALKKKRAREVWLAILLGAIISGLLGVLLWVINQLKQQ